jgi:hypothetical protein
MACIQEGTGFLVFGPSPPRESSPSLSPSLVTERAPAGWVYGVQLQIERPNLLGKETHTVYRLTEADPLDGAPSAAFS